MHSLLTLSALALLGLLVAPGAAGAADYVAGDNCSVLGTSHMAADNTGLVICGLVNQLTPPVPTTCGAAGTTSECKWKSMSGGSCGEWVTVPPMNPPSGILASTTTSPSSWCQIKGYNAASGNCRGLSSVGTLFEGVLLSNQFPGPAWNWTCLWGAGIMSMSSTAEIYCN